MEIFLGFLLPMLLFLLMWFLSGGRDASSRKPLIGAFLLVGIWTTMAVYFIYPVGGGWRDETEIAWVGAGTARSGQELRIGGNDADSRFGWPKGGVSPDLRIVRQGEATAELRLHGGGGFLAVAAVDTPDGGREGVLILGAEEMSPGVPLVVDGRSVTLKESFWRKRVLEIELPELDGMDFPDDVRRSLEEGADIVRAGNKWTGTSNPVAKNATDTSTPLQRVIRRQVVILRSMGGKAAEAARSLEMWAGNVQFYCSERHGKVWLLGAQSTGSTVVKIPTKGDLALVKPGSKVRFRIEARSDGGVDVVFQPPWRVVSRVPPPDPRWQDPDGKTWMTFAAVPRLDEATFILPLSGPIEDAVFERVLAPGESGRMEFFRFGGEASGNGGNEPVAPVLASMGWKGVSSSARLEAGEMSFLFATVEDLPNPWWAVLGLILAAGFASGGLIAVVPSDLGRWRNSMWMMAGILACAWTMLSLRLLLSLRYSLHPSTLDGGAVRAVGMSFSALPLAMTAILVVGGSRYAKKTDADGAFYKRLFVFAFLGAILVWVEYYLGTSLWGNIPGSYRSLPFFHKLSFTLFPLSFVAWVMLSGVGYDHRYMKFLHWFEHMSIHHGPNIWRNEKAAIKPILITLITLLLAVFFIGLFANIAQTGYAFVSELLGSLFFMTLGAIWLGCKSCNLRKGRFWSAPLVSLTLIILGSMVLFPMAFRDHGAIYGNLAIALPICVILCSSRAWKQGMVILAVFFIAFAFLRLSYVKIEPVKSFVGSFSGEFSTRVLTFQEGEGALSRVPTLPVMKDSSGPNAWKMQNAAQHTWANSAMVHLGGLRGAGFGEAPENQLQIPVSTLRYDSLFSCYIVSEYGMLGGIALLLLSAVPLAIVLIGKPLDDRHGKAFAVLLAASYCLEGWIHAAMNLNFILPFTGRNYPLLSVNSTSDLFHWVFLLAIVAQVMFWERPPGDDEDIEWESPVTPDWSLPAFALLGVVTLLLFANRGYRHALDDRLERYDGSRYVAEVRDIIRKGKITWDQWDKVIRNNDNELIGPLTNLGQEISRFNSMPIEERLGFPDSETIDSYRKDVRKLRTPEAYYALLRRLAGTRPMVTPGPRPSLFQLVESPPSFLMELEGEEPLERQYRIAINPAFNNVIDLHRLGNEEALPTVRLVRGEGPGFELRGNRFGIPISTDRKSSMPGNPGERIVTLLLMEDGTLGLSGDSNPGGGTGEIYICSMRTGRSEKMLRFDVMPKGGIRIVGETRLVVGKPGRTVNVSKSNTIVVEPGDTIALDDRSPRAQWVRFAVRIRRNDVVIGPAWAMGKWTLAEDTGMELPFAHALGRIAQRQGSGDGKKNFERIAGAITLDPGMQKSAQRFAAERGLDHFRDLLKGVMSGEADRVEGPFDFRQHLPPRVGVAVIDVPSGETLALGSWPRPDKWNSWGTKMSGEEVPPLDWLESRAPRELQSRYAVDHNFDRLLMGSSTKPIWAAGVIALHPGLREAFKVRGGSEEEHDVFGIEVPGKGWDATRGSKSVSGGAWCDFDSYLSLSDNRYQVRLGFLGLADSERGRILTEPGESPSLKESMDGGANAWRKYPKFREELKFSSVRNGQISNLERAPLFEELWEMFHMGYKNAPDDNNRLSTHRISFWSGDRHDDVYPAGKDFTEPSPRDRGKRILRSLGEIGPEAVNLALDQPPSRWGGSATDAGWTPREYISLLLGGITNRWANVDFAGAFAGAVTGKPVVPHLTRVRPEISGGAKDFTSVSKKLRPGLEDVLRHGTASNLPEEVQVFLASLPGVKVYAKTGTLGRGDRISRMVVALIRWKDGSESVVDRGMAFSLVVENGPGGTATRWFGDFLLENRDAVRRHMGVGEPATRVGS